MKRFASYGSLRKGFYNHDRFGLGEPIATGTVRGAMYVPPNLGYPMLYENGPEDKMRDHFVEIYEVEDNLFRTLNAMELGAGYEPKEVEVAEGFSCTVWFMRPDLQANEDHWVESYNPEDHGIH